ncbi:MAG TPA: polysaccharide pyruvyl transferase family protein [Phycisphaerae bacterium]|nr:polysaccharide pyruvyl transferase family protein [Phycisphaerae bacterium]HOM53743.1 polysaccharide pyruvyl transferase family protein [Phycisphaerae bacterium]HON67232.1 polysaccharide pyruvyl transferase family protein [Phycisphaerae bacterium]HOQ85881.1 polysaccharide pyruvyl transferase family protein [Phycisphaerae bacterium]HPP28003.1 polysaccharide pyruvyl transferase family protein [Phycisphaerae bacterium]
MYVNIRSVTISGYYGHCNTGDDALAATVAWGVVQYLRPKTLNIACRKDLVLPKGLSARFLQPSNWARVEALKRKVQADCHLLGGGSVLHDQYGAWPLLKRLALLKAGQTFGCRTAAIGVSVGPVDRWLSKRVLRRLLSQMAFIGIRDEQSLETVQSICGESPENVTLMMDPAVLIERIGLPEPAVAPRPEKPTIVVAPCDRERIAVGDERRDQVRRDRLSECLNKVLRNCRCRIRLLVMNGSPAVGDERTCQIIAASLPAGSVEIIPYNENPLFAFRVIQQADLVLGMRLHSLIYAYTASVPFIALNYHRKIIDFVRVAAGSRAEVVDCTDFDPTGLAKCILETLETGGADLGTRLPLIEAQARVLAGFENLGLRLGSVTAGH